jgi:hypothetical protein
MPAKKSATKKAGAQPKPIRALYSIPIYEAIKRGKRSEMMEMGAQARKHIAAIAVALGELEKKLAGK